MPPSLVGGLFTAGECSVTSWNGAVDWGMEGDLGIALEIRECLGGE